jgi:release factor glutamine methyltransferase
VTVIEVIKRSAEFLARKGVDSPRLQVELLLAQVLHLPRMGLYLNFERELMTAEADKLRELVKRRGQREPLQHIMGSACFCGLDLEVNPQVLIPRPETEQLAELGWLFLNTLVAAGHPAPTALDFGTGSGCLAIMLAVKCPASQIQAVDGSPEALAVARRNAARHQAHERTQFIDGNGFTSLPLETRFDLIISNPPYIPAAEIETLQPEVRDYDPRLALNGGADGLDFYRRLAAEAVPFLRPGGKIMLEFGDNQGESIKDLFEMQKWIVEDVRVDYSGRSRFLVARRAG